MTNRRDEMSEEELRDRSGWDEDNAQELAPTERRSRAVVSVSLGAADVDTVAMAARRAGMKLSQFIRAAALGKANAATPVYLQSGFAVGEPMTQSVGYSEPVRVEMGQRAVA